jgi:hypothetical protein
MLGHDDGGAGLQLHVGEYGEGEPEERPVHPEALALAANDTDVVGALGELRKMYIYRVAPLVFVII